jgi:hypothetical protein
LKGGFSSPLKQRRTASRKLAPGSTPGPAEPLEPADPDRDVPDFVGEDAA